jgi:hypothetical protein
MQSSKRGFFGDSIYMLILIFVLAIIFVVVAYTAKSLTTTGNASIDANMGNAFDGALAFNSIAPFMVLGIGGALVISAFMVRTMPLLFVFFFVVNCVFAYVSMFLGNAWYSVFHSAGALGAVAQQFTGWTVIWQYLPFISLILGVIFAVVVFAKGGD